MFDRIEELQTKEERLDVTTRNLAELGELLPKNSAVAINLENGYYDISFPTGYIENGLIEALGLPHALMINIEKTSIVLFDDDGRKGLFLASKLPEKECRMGLPGFIPYDSRFYYGAIWEHSNAIEIYSNLGNSVFEKENHGMMESDVNVMYLLCFVLSKVALKTEEDDETGEVRKRLSNVRVSNPGNAD